MSGHARAPLRPGLPVLALSILAPLALAAPASADSCGDLIDRVVSATQATLVKRTADFAEFKARDDIGMTLACGDLSAVGAQFRGAPLPDSYAALFARAGHAITGIPADVIEAAATKARESAATTRHSNVDAGDALVTCSVSQSGGSPVTACAVIDKDDRR